MSVPVRNLLSVASLPGVKEEESVEAAAHFEALCATGPQSKAAAADVSRMVTDLIGSSGCGPARAGPTGERVGRA